MIYIFSSFPLNVINVYKDKKLYWQFDIYRSYESRLSFVVDKYWSILKQKSTASKWKGRPSDNEEEEKNKRIPPIFQTWKTYLLWKSIFEARAFIKSRTLEPVRNILPLFWPLYGCNKHEIFIEFHLQCLLNREAHLVICRFNQGDFSVQITFRSVFIWEKLYSYKLSYRDYLVEYLYCRYLVGISR